MRSSSLWSAVPNKRFLQEAYDPHTLQYHLLPKSLTTDFVALANEN